MCVNGTAPCQTLTQNRIFIHAARTTHCRTSSRDFISSLYCLPQLPKAAWGLWEQRGALEPVKGQAVQASDAGDAANRSREWVCMWAEYGGRKGRTGRDRETWSHTDVPEAQMAYSACHFSSLFQGYHRSNHFIATQGEYPSKAAPLLCASVHAV